MEEPLRRPRCECCDEVLDELLTMRQNYEKFFHRLNIQIVQMRRELGALMADKLQITHSNNQISIEKTENTTSATGKRKNQHTPNSIARKTTRYEHTEDMDDDDDDTENIDNSGGVASTSGARRNSRSSSTKSEKNIKQEPNMSPNSENVHLGSDNLEDQSVDDLVKVLNENEEVLIEDTKYQHIAPDEESFEERNTTEQRSQNRPITINDFYDLRQDFNDFKKTITSEIKQQNEKIYNVIVDIIQDKTVVNKLKPNVEQHKCSLMQEKKRNAKSIFPNNPYKNIKDFKVFEKSIEGDREKFDELVYQFLQLSANGSIKFVKVCWRKLLTDEAAQHFCWKGTDKKDAVRVLRVTAALKTAYDKKYVEHTDIEFERTCMMFFQYAKSRHEKKQAYQVYHSLGKQSAENPDV